MPLGIVKSFDDKKGFGFISPNDGTPDMIFYSADIQTDSVFALEDGVPVEYDLVQNERGIRVDKVRVAG